MNNQQNDDSKSFKGERMDNNFEIIDMESIKNALNQKEQNYNKLILEMSRHSII